MKNNQKSNICHAYLLYSWKIPGKTESLLKNPCIPGIKPTSSWCMIFLICCWILFARILLRIFASIFIKLEIEVPYDPAIRLLGIHIEETGSERDTCTPMFIAALFIIARIWKQPRCPSADEWIRKLWYIYTMEYYSAIKNNSSESVLMRWMKLEPIIQSEVSQKDKHLYTILTHIYGILKDGNYNPICKTEKET